MDSPRDLLGCHVSIEGGVSKSPGRARQLGCNTMQIFTANQRSWHSKPISKEEIEAWNKNIKAYSISHVMSHDSYLINLSAIEAEKLENSLKAFAEEIERCKALGIQLLNFHPGSHLGAGEEAGLNAIISSLKEMLPLIKGTKLRLILENTAGQGTNLGWRFEHLAYVIEEFGNDKHIGICFDTAHGFAAGYDISNERGWEATWKEFDKMIGLKFLAAFHVNDSKIPLGKRVDRHDNIGHGLLGEKAFYLLMNDDRMSKIPKYLETPGGDDGYRADLGKLREFSARK